MKKLLALIGCLFSLSAFSGDLTSEYDKVSDVLIATPFNLQNFERAIKATTHLKEDIDYAPAKSRSLIHIAVNKDLVDAVQLLVEKFHSDMRQEIQGPGSAPLTSKCLYMGSLHSYAYLVKKQSRSENEARKSWDDKAFLKGVQDDAVRAHELAILKASNADHDKIMKRLKTFTFDDFKQLVLPLIGVGAGSL